MPGHKEHPILRCLGGCGCGFDIVRRPDCPEECKKRVRAVSDQISAIEVYAAEIFDQEVVPYVRTTQRQKFVDSRAMAYSANQNALAWLLKANGRGRIVSFPVVVSLWIEYSNQRKAAADFDNILKAMLDASVKAGVLPDDNLRHVSGSRHVSIKHSSRNYIFLSFSSLLSA